MVKIGLALLLPSNMKSHKKIGLAYLDLTLACSKGQCQGRALLWISLKLWWIWQTLYHWLQIWRSRMRAFDYRILILPWPIVNIHLAVGTVYRQIFWPSCLVCRSKDVLQSSISVVQPASGTWRWNAFFKDDPPDDHENWYRSDA